MREIIRLIAFTVVTFGITALAVVLSNPDLSLSIRQRLGLVEAPAVDPSVRLVAGGSVVRVYRPSLGSWLGLSGFPSDTTLRFPIPDTGLIERAQLQLDLETQMLEAGQARVRVLLNDTVRGTVLLGEGTKTETLTSSSTSTRRTVRNGMELAPRELGGEPTPVSDRLLAPHSDKPNGRQAAE